MNKKGTVWVVQDNGRHNYIKASSFGQIKTLLPSRFQVQLDCSEVIDQMMNCLKDFTEDDFILATGDPAAIAIAVAAAAMVNNRYVNLLKYDRHSEIYYNLKMDLGKILFEEEESYHA